MPPKPFRVAQIAGKGRGVIARRPFKFGELVMKITGKVIDDPDYSSRYCIDLGSGRSLEPIAPGAYLNHSCDPNCELLLAEDDTVELRATTDLLAGWEITIDYGWEAEDEPYPCRCGAENCRQFIVDASELPKLLKRKGPKSGEPKPGPPKSRLSR